MSLSSFNITAAYFIVMRTIGAVAVLRWAVVLVAVAVAVLRRAVVLACAHGRQVSTPDYRPPGYLQMC